MLTNGESIQRQRHRQRNLKMERITFRQTAGQYSVISFRQSQVQVLLPVPFRQQYLDGFRFYCGSLIGGIFFGAVTDFGALYASVKNEGKSMGLLIEKYIGKIRTKIILACSAGCLHLLVIAAFADMVAGTFNAYTVSGRCYRTCQHAAKTNGAAGTISLLFIVFAMVFGRDAEEITSSTAGKKQLPDLYCTSCSTGYWYGSSRLVAGKDTWTYITFAIYLLWQL